MPKIALITTGGTIGSLQNEKSITLDGDSTVKFTTLYQGSHVFSLDIFSPFSTHSENITSEHMLALYETIMALDFSHYEGIILTHGTDTLAFTANYLDLVMSLPIPLVLVSANYPLKDKRSNGRANFSFAVDCILEIPSPGVFIAYTNIGEKPKLHKAEWVLQARQTDGYVDSLNATYFAEYLSGKPCRCANAELKNPQPQGVSNENGPNGSILNENGPNGSIPNENGPNESGPNESPQPKDVPMRLRSITLHSDILYIKCYAFMDFACYLPALKQGVRAVVVELYHSGTLNTERFLPFCKAVLSLGIKLVLASGKEGVPYESFTPIACLDEVITVCGQTVERVLIKTMLTLHLPFKDFSAFLEG